MAKHHRSGRYRRSGPRLARSRLIALFSVIAVAVYACFGAGPLQSAVAAGNATVTVTPTTTTTDSGIAIKYTLSYSCSVTGGCPATKVTFPTNALTGDGPTTDFGSWISTTATTCPSVGATGGLATITLGTLPTGTGTCTFTVTPPEYTTFNNAQATITPTISGTGFSNVGAPATLTVTAGHHTSLEAANSGSSAATGRPFDFYVQVVCGQHRGGPNTGDIGYTSVTFTDTLPVGFDFTGWVNPLDPTNTIVGATGTYDSTTRVFTYNDPTGKSCNTPGVDFLSNGNAGGNVLQIRIHGTASNNGTPDPINSTVCDTSAKATVTYLDDGSTANLSVPGSATNCVSIVSPVFGDFASKSTVGAGEFNGGQYPVPTGSGLASNTAYTYPGDWDGTGKSVWFPILVGEVAATNGGVDFSINDPMPCLDNKSAGSAVYTSLPPGPPYCQHPAFVPTTITVSQGFSPTTSDSITVVYTDGTTTTVAWSAGSWVIPASAKSIAEVDIPPFIEEGPNTNAGIVFNLYGYATANVPVGSALTNTLAANAFNVGSNTPLVPTDTGTSSVLVADPAAPSGRIVSPDINAVSQGAGTCKETVFNGASGFGTTVELAGLPSAAVYIDYLAPVGGSISSDATTGFTLQQRQASSGFYQQFTTVGAAVTTGTITPATTPNYHGTGRTLYEWKIPAGTIPRTGMWGISPTTTWVVTLPPGCAGVQQNDLTVGLDGPVTSCLPYTQTFPPAKAVPALPQADSDLATNGAPSGNFCGISSPLSITAINPGFSVDKSVQGNLDPTPISAGGVGNVSPSGGTATYVVSFTNTGGANLTNPVLYDLLPRMGDTQASSTTPRNSQFAVTLTGVGPLPAGVTVSYSASANPCRPEVLSSNPGCTNDWTTTAPADLSTVKALRFNYTGTVFVDPNSGTHTFSVPFTVSTPTTTPGQIAWNTVGANAFAGSLIAPAESSQTGLQAKVGPTITKTTTATSYAKPGDPLTYTYTVTNNTAVTLTNVGVTDNLTDAASSSVAPAVTCQARTNPAATCSGATTILQPNQVATFTATYLVTQDDVDHGLITDTATASGTPPSGGTLSSTSAPVTVHAAQSPALTVVKSAQPTAVTSAGQTVTYSFLVTNTGNVTVTGVGIHETAFSGTGTLSAVTCPNSSLAPGAAQTCAASYAVTQADMDAGSITNTANATGSVGTTPVTSPTSSAIVTATQSAGLSLVKSADPSSAAAYHAGQHITYSYVVTNTGNVTVTGVGIHEVNFTGSNPLTAPTCPQSTLAPHQQEVCTTGYDLTQTDVDGGSTSNTATATGTRGNTPVTSDPSTVTTPSTPAPALTLAKSASPTTVSAVGDTVTYSYLVTNTGNVTVGTIGIDETVFSGAGTAPVPNCPVASLVPGQHETCTATYHVTQADLDAGSIGNTARATGAFATAPVVSPNSFAGVTVTQTPAMTLAKSADPTTVSAVGQTVTYSFLVTNTGNVTLSNIAIDDSNFSGTGTPSAVACPSGNLAPGSHVTCTATYGVTQADLDAGSITNTATASGKPPTGPAVGSAQSTAIVTASQSAALTLVKSADPATASQAGQHITYSYVVTNTGNITVTGVGIQEGTFTGSGTLAPPTCPQATLAPNQQEVCTTGYDLTQTDVNSGSISNTATATGTAGGAPVASDPSTVKTPADATPALRLVKSADPTTVTTVGQTVKYSYLVTNTGNVTIGNVGIDETSFSGSGTAPAPNCPDATLLPGQFETCTASYDVTQADLDAGSITNIASATGTAGNTPVTSPTSSALVSATQAPALTLAKSADPTTVSAVGDLVTYSYLVTNTGNVTVGAIGINETLFSGTGTTPVPNCPAATLAPGAHETCTANYHVTQADLDAGSITNTASATGTLGNVPVSSASSTAVVTATHAPTLTLVKSADPTTVSGVGDTVTYSYLVTNTGNVTVTNVGIDETAFSGTGTAPAPNCPNASLAPGAHETCTASYDATQADLDAGSITNTAAATAAFGADAVTSPASTAVVSVTQTPALTLAKSADPTTVSAVGQTVTYSYLVTNTGNVTVTGIGIDETAFSGTGTAPSPNCPNASLAPGAHETCTATYDVTQADLDGGTVTNTASATGSLGNAPVTSATSTAVITATQSPALTLVKSANPTTVTAAGQPVTFSFLVTNTGNVTLSGIGIDETAFSGTGTLSAINCPATTLAPGSHTTCTATYDVTQADIDAGSLSNTARASGTPPTGPAVHSATSTAIVGVTQSGSLTLVKSASPSAAAAYTVGQHITYSYVVTNTGNVTITGVGIHEVTFTGSGGPLAAPTCPQSTLAPGQQEVCTTGYDLTQTDVDAGKTTNTATATGTAGAAPITSDPSTVTTPATPAPALTLAKSADPTTVAAVGDVVTYSYLVTNTGNVTVTGIGIDETAFTGTGTAPAPNCPAGSLLPGQQETCTATYHVTQADLETGSIRNTAKATGTAGAAAVASDPSTAVVTATEAPGITLTKSAGPTTVTAAGQTVTYSFLVTNTGNVTLSGIGIDETAFSGTGTLSAINCPAITLAPGSHTTCTATYDVTQADIDAGSITNTAKVSADPPTGPPVTSPTSTAVVTATQSPALTLVKSASPSAAAAYTVGQHITYSYVVTNTGNVTIAGVGIHEVTFTGSGPLPSPTCPQSTLAPGQQEVCTTGYDLTQTDIDAGKTTNTATATGTAGSTPVRSDPSTVTTPASPAPALTLVKSADPTTVSTVGQTVTYSYLVTNTGNVTVTSIGIDETAFTGSGTTPAPNCPDASLAPGAHETCTATYHVTQADLDTGSITNTASATGTAGGAPVTSPTSTAIVTATDAPALTLTKSADPATVTAAGQKVTYSFVVTNTGNVTLSGIGIDETAFSGTGTLSAIACPVSTLAPGAGTTCTATYDVTQADIDAGSVTNTANASGTPPTGPAVHSAASTAKVTATQSPALTLVKSASPSAAAAYTVGQRITYTFVVTNTGNVTVTGVAIDDSSFSGSGTLSAISCPSGTTLAPGAETICTATYTLTQADIDAGKVTNSATASGTTPGGDPVHAAASAVTIPEQAHPGLTLIKTASTSTVTTIGQTVTYSFLVTNTGNVTVTGVSIHEDAFTGTGALAAVSCPGNTTLAPGAHLTCTATYHVTRADLATSTISNTAIAGGTTSAGPIGSAPSTAKLIVTASGIGGTGGHHGSGGSGGTGGSGTPLAGTGTPVLQMLGIGALLTVAGALLLIASLRRRPRSRQA